MSEMLIEATLYEHYNIYIKSDTDTIVVLSHLARLRAFMFARNCPDRVQAFGTFELRDLLQEVGSKFDQDGRQECQ